jgi:ABC-2 type transport system ATP-binding protein
MSETIIKTNNLTKIYKDVKVVNNVNMTVNKGDIYGFIGANGAGKTTFMRMIMGLVTPNEGTYELLGKGDAIGIMNARKKIGCIIEAPALLDGFTAVDCMKAHSLLYGKPDEARIKELLDLVGLGDTGKKKVRNFSLGMKQRLAIAQALINKPELLILDEPTNGMDPMGIIEIRKLLQKLVAEHNLTILVSSHILSELQQLATRFGIIDRGILLDEFTAKEIKDKGFANLEDYFVQKAGAQ